jgi:acetylornithine deacetylase/succinyl-diaminopimelate desuccinylase-like protein
MNLQNHGLSDTEEQGRGRIGTTSYSLMKGKKLVAMMTSASRENLDLSDLFASVDQYRQEFLDRLIDYVRRPSISAYGQGIGEGAAYIASVMNQLGLQARILPTALADGAGSTHREADCATRAALRPLRGPASRSAGSMDFASFRAHDPRWPAVRTRRRRKPGPALRPTDGPGNPVGLPGHTALQRQGFARRRRGDKLSLGQQQLDQPFEPGLAERLCAWPTLTFNGLHGGDAGPGSKTVLPHVANATCDIRLVEAQTADEIFAQVEAHIRRHAPRWRSFDTVLWSRLRRRWTRRLRS